jgi:hypothetical protein
MSIRLLVILIVILLFSLTPFVGAQDEQPGAWTAWLYDPQVGVVTLVSDGGVVVREFALPLAQAFDTYSYYVLVSPSGSHVAYVGLDSSADIPNRQLFVYDVRRGELAAAYPLEPNAEATSIELIPGMRAFDEANSQLAVGYVLFDRVDFDADPGWGIVVIDYSVGQVTASVSSEDTGGLTDWDLSVPSPYHFENGVVEFVSIFYATEGLPEYPAYGWDTASGAIEARPNRVSPFSDRLTATGEVVMALQDDRLPFAELPDDPMPFPVVNTVQVIDPESGTRFPFYHDRERTILRANFIQNGERVLVVAYDGVNDSPTGTVVERDGQQVADFELPAFIYQTPATPDGFAYLLPDDEPALVHVQTRGDVFDERLVWQGISGSAPHLIFVQSEVPPAESFAPWAELAEPLPFNP